MRTLAGTRSRRNAIFRPWYELLTVAVVSSTCIPQTGSSSVLILLSTGTRNKGSLGGAEAWETAQVTGNFESRRAAVIAFRNQAQLPLEFGSVSYTELVKHQGDIKDDAKYFVAPSGDP
jgi:hypothetical protein